MKTNVGGMDRVIRTAAGLILIGLTVGDVIGAWGWIGIMPLLTGVFKFCPAYTLFGIKTCPVQNQK